MWVYTFVGGEQHGQLKGHDCWYCHDKRFIYLPAPTGHKFYCKAVPCVWCALVKDPCVEGGYGLYRETAKGQLLLEEMAKLGCEVP